MDEELVCPKDHVIRQVDPNFYGSDRTFVMECDGKMYAQITCNPMAVSSTDLENWQAHANKDHLIQYLRDQIKELHHGT